LDEEDDVFTNLRAVPPLEKATQLLNQAADAGLDWTDAGDLWSRINEELAEAKAAAEDLSILDARVGVRISGRAAGGYDQEQDRPAAAGARPDETHLLLREELGELLFAVIDICRILQVDPRAALEIANVNFESCLDYVSRKVARDGRLMALESPEKLRAIWSEARRNHRCAEAEPFSPSAAPQSLPRASLGTA